MPARSRPRPIHAAWSLLAAVLLLIPSHAFAGGAGAAVAPPGPDWVSPHEDTTIEWWYLNAHVTTVSGRHLAVIGSFFRFGNENGSLAVDSTEKVPQSHYLIYAITDEDTGAHYSAATADHNTLDMLKQALMARVMMAPGDKAAHDLLKLVASGQLPPPTTLFPGSADLAACPFHVDYGSDRLRAEEGKRFTYALDLGKGEYHVHLVFAGERPVMRVGGDGNTGLDRPDDMKYLSLTRCAVTGQIAMGGGHSQAVTAGQGWFDHQWGFTWTTQRAGWDWWGVQLSDGRDILFFRQRNLSTGKPFFPLATVEDQNGKLTVTKNITFTSLPDSDWTSPRSGNTYPLNWKVEMPDIGLTMTIIPVAKDQEMAVLASGGAIWEGSVRVLATDSSGAMIPGTGYQELVGYGERAMAAASGG